MDDQQWMRMLEAEPDNDEVRLAYWTWLEETNDDRAPYVRLMRQRLRLLGELQETDSLLENHRPRVEDWWVDMAFPMRVTSPRAGRCYLKPSPEASPYVEVGSTVTPDTVVCVIEAMKLFYEIQAGVRGVVTGIVVADKAPVEHNQVLFRVSRPSLDFW